jgi:DNA-binding transcriptional MerR regulator
MRFDNTGRAVQVFQPQPDALYSIETVAHLAGIPRRTILVYCKHRLVSPVEDARWGNYFFDDDAIRQLRGIEELRSRFGVNLAGVKFILRLLNEIERLHCEQEMFAE